MHRRIGSCYKHSLAAENTPARDSSYIKEGFRLRLRFMETGLEEFDKEKKIANGQMGRGRKIALKTKKVRKNVKVQESTAFLKTQEMDNKPINLWSFVMTHFWLKIGVRSASVKS